MKSIKKYFLGLFIILSFLCLNAQAETTWVNNLRSLYLSNNAIIYGINIRTFSAEDKNGDGIIDLNAGEKRGNFLSAIKELDRLANSGINTIQLLPVLPVGKIKAIGTAGSLYAPTDFASLNPQLKALKSKLTINEEMEKFIKACHKRNIRVMVDLPCCASYELYLKNPSIFLKDSNQNPLIISDWTDVRVLDAGNNDNINQDVFKLYSDFMQLMISLGVDGVRVNMPEIKPFSFWQKLISQTRKIDPQFLFIAESSSQDIKFPNELKITSPEKLLNAGFDGYYGEYNKVGEWKYANQLFENIEKDINISRKHENKKRVIGNFATHDQISPILTNGAQLSKMIIWLQATLPMNSYYIDGFPYGDTYVFTKANRKAEKSFTDDEYYFAHQGKMDIFNFSRKPQGNDESIFLDYVIANKFKSLIPEINSNGKLTKLRTNNNKVFAYTCSDNSNKTVLVVGNLDFFSSQNASVTVPKFNDKSFFVPIKFKSIPLAKNNKIEILLEKGEISVLLFDSSTH